ncbi:MAG: FkbM family methyltransferase [Acidobacteria bacterium]|nr:FkbM family methyltransferase [Acidobacteriota bacterium]
MSANHRQAKNAEWVLEEPSADRSQSVCPRAAQQVKESWNCETPREPSTNALLAADNQKRGTTPVTVRTLTLDQYFADSKPPKPNLINIAVEGAELNVLRGARTLLERAAPLAPVLICEYGPFNMARFGYSGKALINFLHELGYRLYAFRNCDFVRIEHSPVLPGTKSTCNLIATKVPLPLS